MEHILAPWSRPGTSGYSEGGLFTGSCKGDPIGIQGLKGFSSLEADPLSSRKWILRDGKLHRLCANESCTPFRFISRGSWMHSSGNPVLVPSLPPKWHLEVELFQAPCHCGVIQPPIAYLSSFIITIGSTVLVEETTLSLQLGTLPGRAQQPAADAPRPRWAALAGPWPQNVNGVSS